ncbi:plasmid stabilization system protein ParE [Flavobacterium sp. CG_9.10]|uniref:type II toxin-antitoxin system RelE/ParE family toxin n=1 Tax=Flavobacterium sp. CG_9.10 TaxID=2787729 RepID=UPI0018CBB15F|nr:type II toxin-antitoxin system RelE/ParE family toxin [Flavobacterium sp. CG_9.10]MBG6110912.1 plasmid stabilization system protein ParE [Flavobacterium sp. CG_9.10]
MSYKIIVSPIASKNIEDAVEFYIYKASKKVALDFLKDYRKTYQALKINPLHQFHDVNYRFLPFSKFPYVAFFIVDELSKTVFLNAIFHTSQEPDSWKKENK